MARFEVRHAQQQAKKLGPHIEKLVDHLLSGQHPLRHLRRVQGILRLSKRYPITAEALDHACQRALTFNKTRLAYIKTAPFTLSPTAKDPRCLPRRENRIPFICTNTLPTRARTVAARQNGASENASRHRAE